jgi:hypothetical protein
MQARSIKRILSRTILGISLAVSVVSCKKDKNENPDGPGSPNGTKIAMFREGDEYIKFDYNNDGSVKNVIVNTESSTGGDEFNFTVKYDGQKRITALESQWQTIDIAYQNNAMSKATIKQAGTLLAETSFQYVNGNIQSSTLFIPGEGDILIPLFKYEMTYNTQGNVSRANAFLALDEENFEPAGYVNFQYDGKDNPLYEQRQIFAIFGHNISKHNTTVEDHFFANNAPEDKFQVTYTYNAKGKPEKAKVKQGLPNETQTETERIYTYK